MKEVFKYSTKKIKAISKYSTKKIKAPINDRVQYWISQKFGYVKYYIIYINRNNHYCHTP